MRNQPIRNQFSQFKIDFNVIAENQPNIFTKQSIVYTSSVKNKAKKSFKREKG